jgi:hypothetical protein
MMSEEKCELWLLDEAYILELEEHIAELGALWRNVMAQKRGLAQENVRLNALLNEIAETLQHDDQRKLDKANNRIAELEQLIADNCDPCNATEDDAKIIQECFYATYPENLYKREQT